MKKGMKKLISAVLAAMTAATLAITAFAADYTHSPTFPTTPSQNVSVTTSELKEAVNNASDGVVSVTSNSLSSLSVSVSVLKALDNADAVLEIVSPKAVITIDPDTITKIKKLDLSMKVYSTENRAVVKMKRKKDFGCEVTITLTDCKMSAEKLAKAHVYCDDEDLGPVVINEDGCPVITVTKGGKYEIK